MYSIQNDSPRVRAKEIEPKAEFQILTYKVNRPSANKCRVRLKVRANSNTWVFAWVTIPTNTLYCLQRSSDPITPDVKVGAKNGSFVYKKIRFPVGDARDKWFSLNIKE